MKATGKYQEFDPLTAEEYAALERSILDQGVQVPIVLDEDGTPIDGHHRLKVCQKHGITNYPTETKRGLTEEQKRNLAQSLNMARRSLTRAQKQQQIRNRLQRNPEHSDRLIAQQLGVDHKTVGRMRTGMESTGEIPQVERKVGVNGTRYKAPSKAPAVDVVGGEIPQHLERNFTTCRAEHLSIANSLVELKRRAVALAERSPLHANLAALKHHLESAEVIFKQTSPHAIHQACGAAGCDQCGGRGFFTCGEFPQLEAGTVS